MLIKNSFLSDRTEQDGVCNCRKRGVNGACISDVLISSRIDNDGKSKGAAPLYVDAGKNPAITSTRLSEEHWKLFFTVITPSLGAVVLTMGFRPMWRPGVRPIVGPKPAECREFLRVSTVAFFRPSKWTPTAHVAWKIAPVR
jgi:hypothetical protein